MFADISRAFRRNCYGNSRLRYGVRLGAYCIPNRRIVMSVIQSKDSCKGCEDTEAINEDSLCGYCAADCDNGWRCEDSGELTNKGEAYYKR